ncbi:MAG: UvrD-helicase domain-containing protein [Polyangiales bacterium]
MTDVSTGTSVFELPTLVEASAGTGKTHAITTYFVQAILEQDLTPEQILVVTYTKAAAAELRRRTRTRVAEALALAQAAAPGDDLAPVVAEAIRRFGHDEVVDRLRRARREMDRAPIFTIHGMCQRLLQDHPLLFGIDVDFEIAEDAVSVFRDLATDFWTTELHRRPSWFVQALRARRITPEFLGRLAGASAHGDVAIVGPAPATLDEAHIEGAHMLLREAGSIWWADRQEIAEVLLEDPGLNRNGYKKQSVRTKWLPGLDELFTSDSLVLPDWFAKLRQRHMRVKRGFEAPRHRFFEACEALFDALEGVLAGVDYEVFRFQERFIEWVRDESTQRTRREGLLTYDDLLSNVHRALNEQTAAVIRSTYPVALVDEFQDTDSTQYAIFKAIYGEHAAVYVGDPKQAIYSFRGADVFSYLDAATDVGARRLALTTNRRSDPRMVAAVNTLFSMQVHPFVISEIEFPRAIAYHESRSTFEPAMEILFLERPEKRKGNMVDSVPDLVANEIGVLLGSDEQIEGRSVIPSDIAVLCRTNRQALLVTEALRRLDVPTSLDGDSSVLSTATAGDVEYILEAALMPGDATAVRRALLTQLVGVTPEELHMISDEDWSRWLTRFRDWHDQWHQEGVVRFFEELLRTCAAETRIAQRTTAKRQLTDLLHIEELLLRGERERHRDPVALMLWFRRLRQGNHEDTSVPYEDLQQRPDSDADTVRVTTIHKAKGLEYGVVYCPFLWGDAQLFAFEKRVVKFHDADDAFRTKRDLGSASKDSHLEESERESLSEAIRLLYVGVTRAKYRCTLVWGAARRWRDSALAYLIHGVTVSSGLSDAEILADVDSLVEASEGSIAWRLPTPTRAKRHAPSASECRLEAENTTRGFSHANRIASFTSLTGHHEKTAPRSRDAPQPVDPDALFSNLPGGARTGLLLHTLLEHLPHDALSDASHLPLVEYELESYGYESGAAAVVLEDLHTVATTALLDQPKAPSLATISRNQQLRELEFMMGVEDPDFEALGAILRAHEAPGGSSDYADQLASEPPRALSRFLRGFIDLVFEWEGRWYVADYKSNSLPDYDPGSLIEAAAASHYILQLQLYAAAAHRYLAQRVPDYDPATDFGGAMLLFVRGMHGAGRAGSGVYFAPQPAGLLRDVDGWLGGGS